MKEKVVLAYSGGLDTSVILAWLCDQGYDVICFIADVGQEEDFEVIKQRALAIGACKVIIKDLKQEFVEHYIFQALKANACYEGTYLLGTALSRPLIAYHQLLIAEEENTKFLAHGATGKGNDQVRFELTYRSFMPDAIIISPWKDTKFIAQFKGRKDLIDYAQKHNIPISSTKEKPYSIDANLMHTSYEGGILENPASSPPSTMFSMTRDLKLTPNDPTFLTISFKGGVPVLLSDKSGILATDILEIFKKLNQLAGMHGIGRIDIVESRFIGMKSRGVYETPAATVLHIAHKDIEGIAMDREVMRLVNMLTPKFAEIIYNGFWFSPEMDFLMAAIEKSQELIDGSVHLCLYKGNVMIEGRESPSSLYNKKLSSMDIEGGFDQTDSKGFIRINAIRLMAHRAIVEASQKK